MNCRAHGACGSWLPAAAAALGATQVDLALDGALGGGAALAARPDAPAGVLRTARLVFHVSYFEGVIGGAPDYDAIRALPSYAASELQLGVGDALTKSVDCCSIAGMATLIHDDPAVVDADYAAIRALEEAPGALFAVAPVAPSDGEFKLLVEKGKSLSFKE